MGEFDFLFLTARETRILFETLGQSFVTAAIVTVLIAGLGTYFVIVRSRVTRILRIILIVPLLIPPYFHALSWLHLFQFIAYSGGFGLVDLSTVQAFRSLGGVVFIHTISYLPIACVLLFATLSRVNHASIAVALIHRPLQNVITRVIIPQLGVVLISVFGVVFTLSFVSFDVPSLLEVSVYFTEIFSVISNSYDLVKAVSMSIIPLVIAVGGAYALTRSLPDSYKSDNHDLKINLTVSPWVSRIFYVTVLLIILVSLVVPLVTILMGSSWEIQVMRTVFVDWVEPAGSTVLFAFVGSMISIVVSLVMYPWWRQYPLVRIIGLSSLLLPPMSVGLGILYISHTSLLSSIISSQVLLLVGYVIRTVPLTTEILHVLKQRISPEVILSFKLTTPRSIMKQFMWWATLLLPALAMMFFVSSWYISSEIPLTILLQPAGMQTIMARIFILLHYGSLEYMNTMMLMTLGLLCIPLMGIFILFRKRFYYG